MSRSPARRRSVRLFAAVVLLVLGMAACGPTSDEPVGTVSKGLVTKCGVPSSGPVQGYDVSYYQGNFDWAAAKADGRVFGIARVSDSTTVIDPQFESNWAKMKANGIYRGAYQYFRPNQDVVAQANILIGKIGKLGKGDMPAMIDVESAGGQSAATIVAKVQEWMDLVEAGTGKQPILYTGPYFWRDSVGNDQTLAKYPLVTAHYNPSSGCPLISGGWSAWTIWQYSDGGGAVDHDVFNGTLEDFQRWVDGESTPSYPPYPRLVRRSQTDIDGDGNADLCARGKSGILCDLSHGSGFSIEIDGPAWSDAKGWARPEYGHTIQYGDVNGDGKADVCARDALGMICDLSNGSGFPTEIRGPAWSDDEDWAKPEYYETIQLADVNGDGMADVCGRDARGILCSLSNGNGFPTGVLGPAWSDAAGWNQDMYYTMIQFADVNGDGMADVCGRDENGVVCYLSDGNGFPTEVRGPNWSNASGWSKVEYGSTIRFVDINGDGKADVCGRAARGMVCSLSSGHAFGPELSTGPEWSDAKGWAEYYRTIQFADINGDGKADVCARAGSGMVCSISRGSAFSPEAEIAGPEWSDAKGWNQERYYATIMAGDLNDDGKDDLCARSAKGIVCALSTGAGFGNEFDGPALADSVSWDLDPYGSSIRLLGSAKSNSRPEGVDTNPDPETTASNGTPGGSGGCAASPRPASAAGVSLGLGLALAMLARRRR
ncbi:MAG: FG-GAP-like repeat-containing protein [Polyangiaceae bacterium]|nr:FG-GAP-like repeat-containing protein [Polyangiaceae bacterium]